MVAKRIESGVKRPDIMQFVLENNSSKGMSRGEIEATVNLAMIAGSDTSATALTGLVWYLLHNPQYVHLSLLCKSQCSEDTFC